MNRGGKLLCALLVLASTPVKLWLDDRNNPPAAPETSQGHHPAEVAISPILSYHDMRSPAQSIPTPAHSRVNHSPSLAALPDGGLAMAWFGGSREGARDVQIFFARFDGERWSQARALFGTDGLIRSSGRYLTKLGNPVLHAEGSRLHLWFVSVSLGGWGGSRLNHSVSLDGGRTWSTPKLLVTSPFLNVSTLVRTAALNAPPGRSASEEGPAGPFQQLRAQEILLPAYFELSHKYPLLLRLDAATGEVLDREPFGGLTGLLQPSLVRSPSNPYAISAYFRRAQAIATPRVYQSESRDGGLHWSLAEPIAIPNGDASVVAWQDLSTRWLVANPEPDNRQSIAVYGLYGRALVPDGTRVPPAQILDKRVPIANGSAAEAAYSEFSYPSMAQTLDGRLHLVYTADGRTTIRHRIWNRLPGLPPDDEQSAPADGGAR